MPTLDWLQRPARCALGCGALRHDGDRTGRRLTALPLAVVLLSLTSWLGCERLTGAGPVVRVAVTPAGTSISGVGAMASFTVVAWDADGHVISSPMVDWSSLNPPVATIDESGNATAVASGQVTIAAKVDGQVGYALLTVSTPEVSPVTSWTVELAEGPRLEGVWGTSSNDVYVVGRGGTILHSDGVAWSAMVSGTTGDLYGVWGTSSTDVYAVGGFGAILHYDGASWSGMPSGTTEALWGVWGTSPSDIYAVGGNSTILRYDGTAWGTMTVEATATLRSVWGTSSSDIYAVGHYQEGMILHYDGLRWSPMIEGFYGFVMGVWGTSSSDVYAVGGEVGTIQHGDGHSWSTMESGTIFGLGDVSGTSSSDIYAVGFNGTILHYDGNEWSAMTSAVSASLYAVWASSSDAYAVGRGEYGVVLKGAR